MQFRTRVSEIIDFFQNTNFIERSAVLGIGRDGRTNGFGAILFNSREEAENAIKKLNGQYIGERYVDLSLITYGDYSVFNGVDYMAGATRQEIKQGSQNSLSSYLNAENIDKALIMRGCPWRITIEEVQEFYEGHYGAIPEDKIYIEQFNGRRTGTVLVIFESHEDAQRAKTDKHNALIGEDQRYVELFDKNDEFMKKVCKLFGDDE